MKCIHHTRWLLVSFPLFFPAIAASADWSSNSVSYRYGNHFTEPGNKKEIGKHILQFTHTNGYAYGQHFLNVDALLSDKNDPANNSNSGAQEVYIIYNHQLSLSKTTGYDFSFGPIKDVAILTGFDLNTKNTAFAPRARKIIAGTTFKFDVPKGFLDFSVLYYKEWNHNGINTARDHDLNFDSTYRLALNWSLPLPFETIPVSFDGFLNHTGKKGKDGFGIQTKAETQTDMFLMVDMGQILFSTPQTFKIGPGYQYWHNKFGGSAPSEGTKTSTAMIKATYIF